MQYIKCKIFWKEEHCNLKNRVFLFCINSKCMSGRITEVEELEREGDYEIKVNFIDQNYFEEEAIVGNKITIQEAFEVLSEGEITWANKG